MFGSLFNRRTLSLAVVSLLASSAVAEVSEHLSSVPAGWHYARSPKESQPMQLQLALKQSNVEGFEEALLNMSTPGHRDYGKHHKSYNEMKRMLQPNDKTVDAVEKWLKDAHIKDFKRDADWMTFNTTVDQANDLLKADFQWYNHADTDVQRLRTLKYSLPDSLDSHVNFVTPTTRFGQLSPQHITKHGRVVTADASFAKQAASADVDCNKLINPQCLKDLYSIPDRKVDTKNGNKIGFANYLDQYPRKSDLKLFAGKFADWIKDLTFKVITWNGGKNDQDSDKDSSEANLDLQYIMGISYPVPVTAFSIGGRGELVPDLESPDIKKNDNEPYLDFFQKLVKMAAEDLPQVISTSYGEDEQSVPVEYAKSVCNLIAQVSSRGVSVIFSSGDSGVGAACQTNDGKKTTHFPPQFPAACPWVTAVGATTGNPEEAVDFSSGGFSDIWARPDWQDKAVNTYLDYLGDKWDGLFNRKGRGFPDVAAQGKNFAIYNQGKLGQVHGTSAAAPVFAGIIALLNDALISDNKPPLGFLNPWIYANPEMLNDITKGRSTGCDGNSRFNGPPNKSPVVAKAGWDAHKGWDPVTGHGTPNFPKMLDAAKKAAGAGTKPA